jgi:hypothetical protein
MHASSNSSEPSRIENSLDEGFEGAGEGGEEETRTYDKVISDTASCQPEKLFEDEGVPCVVRHGIDSLDLYDLEGDVAVPGLAAVIEQLAVVTDGTPIQPSVSLYNSFVPVDYDDYVLDDSSFDGYHCKDAHAGPFEPRCAGMPVHGMAPENSDSSNDMSGESDGSPDLRKSEIQDAYSSDVVKAFIDALDSIFFAGARTWSAFELQVVPRPLEYKILQRFRLRDECDDKVIRIGTLVQIVQLCVFELNGAVGEASRFLENGRWEIVLGEVSETPGAHKSIRPDNLRVIGQKRKASGSADLERDQIEVEGATKNELQELINRRLKSTRLI